MSNTMYDGFLSKIYDYCPYFGRDREQIVKYYILELSHIPNGTVLELGTATGSLTIPILNAGYYIDSVDYSEDMHKIVKNKLANCSEESKDRLRFILSDITQLKLDKEYDAIIIPDSLLAVLDSHDNLNRVLEICHNALKDGGILLFDIYKPIDNLQKGNEYVDATRFRDDKKNTYIVEVKHTLDPRQQKQISRYFYKARVSANKYAEVASFEIVYHYKYLNQIFSLLKEIGFSSVKVQEIFDNDVYFVAAKKVN